MTELTDLEITKRIATIAYPKTKTMHEEFNPLQNGDIICDLIEQYELYIKTDCFGQIWVEFDDGDGYSKGVGIDRDLKRAVCLCLIEAFNEDLK